MEKMILRFFGSFPSSQLLLIYLKSVWQYFELSVHMLFSGESYTWCNALCFEVAWHLLLLERIMNVAFFFLHAALRDAQIAEQQSRLVLSAWKVGSCVWTPYTKSVQAGRGLALGSFVAYCSGESGVNAVVMLESLEKKNKEKCRQCLLYHEWCVRVLEYLWKV